MPSFRGMTHIQFWVGISVGLMVAFLLMTVNKTGPTIGFDLSKVNPRHDHRAIGGAAGADGHVGDNLHEEFEKHVQHNLAGGVKFEDKHAHHGKS